MTDTNVVRSRRISLATIASLAGGLAVFTWCRWEEVTHWGGHPEPALVVPIVLTYLAAAAAGLLLLKDGVTRWWWVPGTALVVFGFPVDHWVGWSVISTRFGFAAGSIVDLLTVLAPALVAWLGARGSLVRIHGRLIPALLVTTISAVLAMRVGIDGPDLSLPVGATVLALGIFSQSSSWQRASAFLLIAVSLGAQIPASLAVSLSQGAVGPIATADASVDIAVAVLAFSIAPMTPIVRRLLARHGGGAPVHAPS